MKKIKKINLIHSCKLRNDETIHDAENRCFLEAQREAIERTNVFVVSDTKINNNQVIEDNIEIFTASFSKINVKNKKMKVDENRVVITYEVQFEIDIDKLEKIAQRILESPIPFQRAKYENNKQMVIELGKFILYNIEIRMNYENVIKLLGLPQYYTYLYAKRRLACYPYHPHLWDEVYKGKSGIELIHHWEDNGILDQYFFVYHRYAIAFRQDQVTFIGLAARLNYCDSDSVKDDPNRVDSCMCCMYIIKTKDSNLIIDGPNKKLQSISNDYSRFISERDYCYYGKNHYCSFGSKYPLKMLNSAGLLK